MTNKSFGRWAAFGCIKGPSRAGKSEIPDIARSRSVAQSLLEEKKRILYDDLWDVALAQPMTLEDAGESPCSSIAEGADTATKGRSARARLRGHATAES